MRSRLPLPIDDALAALAEALRAHGRVVLSAETGAGKTTRVPPAIVDEGLAGEGSVIVLEPRRIAARAAAARVASERGSSLGAEVGYAVRFDRRASAATRVLFVTEGIFLRMVQADPFLDGIGAVVLDEFHERSLASDLALALVSRLQTDVRPDLRLAVMSATLDTDRIAAHLGDCPVVASTGRTFPVSVRYLPPRPGARDGQTLASAVTEALEADQTGDLLVFLPGVGEIRRAATDLASLAAQRGLTIAELYGDLPPERQDAALRRGAGRRLILATNVAQTSVTVEGVTVVIDTGTARVPRLDRSVGLPRLGLERISQAAADQRAGRAGRTAPGVCIRLWSRGEHVTRARHDEPEIRRADLAPTVLQLLCLGESDLDAFPWLDAPREGELERATALLHRLGAVDSVGRPIPTELGRAVVRLPVHPRLGRALVEGHALGHLRPVATAAALLAERDVFGRDRRAQAGARASESDVLDRIDALRGGLRSGSAHHVRKSAEQLARQSTDALGRSRARGARAVAADEAVQRALLAGFPDRVAKRRDEGGDRGVLVGGRGVRLAPQSAVRDADLFLCLDLDAGRGGERAEARVRIASAVDREWLPAHLVATCDEVEFDAVRERVVAVRRTRYLGLVIEQAEGLAADTDDVARVLAEAAQPRLAEVLPVGEREVAAFLARVRWLRGERPELGLPAFDDDDLITLLRELCDGRRSFSQLRRAPLLAHLKGRLTHEQSAALGREAPERVTVPSGSRVALTYEPGRPPVLAVRIQEMFGLPDTPRVAGGRVPVLLHLLAPNQRPQQVTQDLASFWQSTYSQVRKDLRRRYPRHAWPEDPLAAKPEHRPRRRR